MSRSLGAAIALGLGAATWSSATSAVTVQGQFSRAEIAVDRGQEGSARRVVIRITPTPGWHTYWSNPGDGGMPPRLSWDHPPASQSLRFPTPDRFASDGMVTFGYDKPVALVADVRWSGAVGAERGRLAWAVCDGKRCALEQAAFVLDEHPLQSTGTSAYSMPVPAGTARWRVGHGRASLSVPAQRPTSVVAAYFFPHQQGAVEPKARQLFDRAARGEWRLSVPLPRSHRQPSSGVLSLTFADGTRQGYAVGAVNGGTDAVGR